MADEKQEGAGPFVALRERYRVFPATPLPDLDTPTAQAFMAEDGLDEEKPLFALVVHPGVVVRMNALRALKGIEGNGVMALEDWGVIDWPPLRRKVVAILYARPLGGRVMADLASEIKRIEDFEVVAKVVAPAAAALAKLSGNGLSHRAIRPTNMFWTTQAKEKIVLGDCATGPPASGQPALLEPVESAMAHPTARGEGGIGEDLYALGASLAVLLVGRAANVGLADSEVIRAKILHGSYSVVVGEDRLPVPIVELLRGLLSDDARERWSRESLDQWINGRRLPPLGIKLEKRPARAFTFAGRDYQSVRELAMDFVAKWDEAMPVILDGKLELWLRRALDFKEKANAIAMTVQTTGYSVSEKRMANDVMLARVCMILDPTAPIRYKTLAFLPEGFGTMLAMTMSQGGDPKLLMEALMRDLVHQWAETREGYNPEVTVIETRLRQARNFYERASIGHGVERAVYDLCEAVPCLSTLVSDEYVLEMRDLLPALNASAKKADNKSWPVDRHIAAFITARTNFDVERQLNEIADPGVERSTLAMLNLLATIQWRLSQTGLYGLVSWVGGLMQPAINSYHSRVKRRELEREVPRIVRQGSLVDLSRLLDNPEERAKDQLGFEEARAEWLRTAQQIKDIEQGRDKTDEKVMTTSQQVAGFVSVCIAGITVVIVAISRLF